MKTRPHSKISYGCRPKVLKPLNPQYPMIEINGNCKIIGVVVDAKLANLP
ncbi:putative CI repressor [Salmonella phage 34]|uniref:Putative CI repressor n=1 Tax=Salmonella phage 34 TaxID=1654887 RepID=A0A0N6WGE2_BPP22|nr:putative CI repressor [Salmonella phage 34]